MIYGIAEYVGRTGQTQMKTVRILNATDVDCIGVEYCLDSNLIVPKDRPFLVKFNPQDQFCKPVSLTALMS